MGLRVGIGTGGTFTDLVAVDEASGQWRIAKVPSRPDDPVGTIVSALEAAELDPADCSFVVVGTTLGINAVLTRSGARVLYDKLQPEGKSLEDYVRESEEGIQRTLY